MWEALPVTWPGHSCPRWLFVKTPELKRLTEEAVRRGIFGAPIFFVGDEMFFGRDRMPRLENYLSVSRGAEI
jgi:hypothetical protein